MQKGRKNDRQEYRGTASRKIEAADRNRNTGKGRNTAKSRNTGKSGNTEKSRNTGKNGGTEKSRNEASVSQNFITEQKLIRRIIRLSGIGKEDTVLEIGTGKGHLTEALCREAGYVHSVEIDRRLYESAGKRLVKQTNLTLIHGDFLQYHLPEKGDYLVFANIPFFITTQIVNKLTSAVNPPKDIWLVMEKGAAKRFMGLPKESQSSLLLKVHWEMEVRYHFRREDFHPIPSVDTVLLHFSLKPVPDLGKKEFDAFRRFVAYSMKYGICGKKGQLTNRQAEAALKRAGLPHAHEDGVTLYIQWLCLFRCWWERK
ncbi:MAG: hypothetical protein HDQ98_15380 [Lachnospiraceae bacterium]|nr:hypothetical protein [Lachnospiraceae bacterium]